MNKAAILHIPKSQYSFAYSTGELRIRLRAAKSELDKVEIRKTNQGKGRGRLKSFGGLNITGMT